MALFTIYSSSAGSGKTYTLTKEYLKLLLQSDSPLYFQHILTMTFTNEAAKEMKDRILETLKIIAEKKAEKPQILIDIERELENIPTEILENRAKQCFYAILQNYNDFAVKTLDSFVNQVVSSFTFDLNLPYNYEIILDIKEVIKEAVRNLIDRIGNDDKLTLMFKDYALENLEDNSSWNTLENDINKFALFIYNHNNGLEIEKNMDLTYDNAKSIKKQIRDYIKAFEEEVAPLGQKGLDLLNQRGLTHEDLANGNNGIVSLFKSAGKKDIKKINKPSATILKLLDSDKWQSSKNKDRIADLNEIKEELRALGKEIISKDSDKYLFFDSLQKNVLKLPFLTLIKKEIDTILADRNQVFLADFNRKILEVVSQEPVPYIFERIGEKYNHILVDEFQDTADIQFFNLLPLFENTISKNLQNLIVGDPKQAIYSWRGGNVMLMLDLIAQDGQYLKSKSAEIQHSQIDVITHNVKLKNLSTNWRSKEQIIEFNNALFTSITQIQTQSNHLIPAVYNDYIQLTPPQPKKGGYVEVKYSNPEEYQNDVVELMKSLLEEGYQPGDIAFLIREKRHGKVLAEILRKEGYQINSKDSLLISNFPEVQLVIAAVRFAHKPEKEYERFELLQWYLVLQNIPSESVDLKTVVKLNSTEFMEYLKNQFQIDLMGIHDLTPYALVEFIIERFQLMQRKNAIEALLVLLDFAFDFTQRLSKSIGDFLEKWETKKESLNITNPSPNAVTLQTIHASKGLQYPVVILPNISWELEPNHHNFSLWLNIEDLEFQELEHEGKRLKSAEFKSKKNVLPSKLNQIEAEYDIYGIESLNLLYVALTRAEERQYLWLTNKNNKLSSVAKLFEPFLATTEDFDPSKKVFSFGTKEPKIQKEKTQDKQTLFTLDFPPTFQENKLLKLNTNHIIANDKIETGNTIHLVFERIKKASDVQPTLNILRNRGLELPADIEEKIEAVIQHPDLKLLFDEKALIKNEVEILSNHSEVRRPDRVIFVNNEVYVVDYKTGKKLASHGKQLKEYGQLLRQMGYPKINLLLVYLEPLNVVKVKF